MKTKKNHTSIILPLVAIFLFSGLLSGCRLFNRQNKIEDNTTTTAEPVIKQNTGGGTLTSSLACYFLQDNTSGISGGDVGMGIAVHRKGVYQNKNWIFFGDTRGTDKKVNGVSALAILPQPFTGDCAKIEWPTEKDSKGQTIFFKPVKHDATFKDDLSNVAEGGIEIGDTLYLFIRKVTQWDFLTNNGTHTYGEIYKENASKDGYFSPTGVKWNVDQVHASNAPVKGTLSDGTEVIYMATTAEYRKSPVYMSYVEPSKIEDKTAYKYYGGSDSAGAPIWLDASKISDAKPLPGLGAGKANVGELSMVYNSILKKYMMMFNNYGRGFQLYVGDKPYGPYTVYKVALDAKSWAKEGWSGTYGGYIIPESFGADGKDLYFTISLWKPYTTVILKIRLS